MLRLLNTLDTCIGDLNDGSLRSYDCISMVYFYDLAIFFFELFIQFLELSALITRFTHNSQVLKLKNRSGKLLFKIITF